MRYAISEKTAGRPCGVPALLVAGVPGTDRVRATLERGPAADRALPGAALLLVAGAL
jgi:hypothetical protein